MTDTTPKFDQYNTKPEPMHNSVIVPPTEHHLMHYKIHTSLPSSYASERERRSLDTRQIEPQQCMN